MGEWRSCSSEPQLKSFPVRAAGLRREENHLRALQATAVRATPAPVTGLKPADDANVRHASLTRTLKGRGCDGGGTGLRERKPPAWGQRASERDEGPLQTRSLLEAPRLPEGLPVGPRGLRLAQATGPVSQKWGDISAPSFSACCPGPPPSSRLRRVTSTHPARSSHWRGAPFGEAGGCIFEVKYCTTARNGKY